MFLSFEDRPSDSPLVERIWRSRSERAGVFSSVAACERLIGQTPGQETTPARDDTLRIRPGSPQ